MMRGLRHWLVVVALLFGQMTVLAHGVEHLATGTAETTCTVCLAGHGLDAAPLATALPVLVSPPPPAPADTVVPVLPQLPRVPAQARGPPQA